MEYREVLERLRASADEEYRKFNEGLIPGAEQISLGVRMPELRALAKELCKGDWRTFLRESEADPLYETVMLRGLVIAGAKCESTERLALLEGYLPCITNWAVCDCVASSLKFARTNPAETLDFLKPCLRSEEEYRLRFGLVMLMDYYVTDEYIDFVLEIYQNVRHDGYYVKMAVAWGLSVCFVKYRDKTMELLRAQILEPWTQNKTIQKCRESRRVSEADKALLLRCKL